MVIKKCKIAKSIFTSFINIEYQVNTKKKKNKNIYYKERNGKFDVNITPIVVSKLAKASAGLSIGQISDSIDKAIVKAVKKKQNITEEQLLGVFK